MLPAAQSVRWHFPLLGPVLLPGHEGSRGSVTGVAGSPHPGARERNCVWLGQPLLGSPEPGLGTPCPRHTWLVLQMCVSHVVPSNAAGKLGPQREFVLGEVEKECGSWLRGCQGKGRKGRRGKKRKVVTSGWKVITDWLVYSCFLAATSLPSVFFFFFLLLVCFRFLICKVKSFFLFPRRIKKAKNTGKEEERKVTHSFPDSFTKHRAERKRKEVIWRWTWEHLLAVCLWRTYLTSLSKCCYP